MSEKITREDIFSQNTDEALKLIGAEIVKENADYKLIIKGLTEKHRRMKDKVSTCNIPYADKKIMEETPNKYAAINFCFRILDLIETGQIDISKVNV